jgi:hypothetical protein
MNKIVKVLIHSLTKDSTYVVTSLRECKTALDQNVYEMAMRKKETVLLREVCAQPIFESDI